MSDCQWQNVWLVRRDALYFFWHSLLTINLYSSTQPLLPLHWHMVARTIHLSEVEQRLMKVFLCVHFINAICSWFTINWIAIQYGCYSKTCIQVWQNKPICFSQTLYAYKLIKRFALVPHWRLVSQWDILLLDDTKGNQCHSPDLIGLLKWVQWYNRGGKSC